MIYATLLIGESPESFNFKSPGSKGNGNLGELFFVFEMKPLG